MFHEEMHVLGQKWEESGERDETINKCVARRLNLFRCGHIEELWKEARSVRTWPPQTAPAPNTDDIDKSVQDSADKDNYRSAYARAVKAVKILQINWRNKKALLSKYPERQHGHVPRMPIPPRPEPGELIQPPPLKQIPGDIISSIRRQNKGRANGLFMDSLDLFIRLVDRDCVKINKALR